MYKIHGTTTVLLKRLMDVIISLPIVVIVIPILSIFVLLAQKIQSPGPLFYRQRRRGIHDTTFTIIKFRTMTDEDDSHVYRFGSFLRRTSLDELPQFINVLFGEMSVTGPRPFSYEHDALYRGRCPNYKIRSTVKPGVTGLSQSMGLRGEIKTKKCLTERVKYDTKYIREWSWSMEIKIIYQTALQVIKPPNTAV